MEALLIKFHQGGGKGIGYGGCVRKVYRCKVVTKSTIHSMYSLDTTEVSYTMASIGEYSVQSSEYFRLPSKRHIVL